MLEPTTSRSGAHTTLNLSQKLSPFLALPTELRLMVYAYLFEEAEHDVYFMNAQQFQQHPGRLFNRWIKRLTFHEPFCHTEILRTCRTIFIEARPEMQKRMRFDQYHVSCYGYSMLELMTFFNQALFREAVTLPEEGSPYISRFVWPMRKASLKYGCFIDFLRSTENFRSCLRARRTSARLSFLVDYYL